MLRFSFSVFVVFVLFISNVLLSLQRLHKITNFLLKADRFHGAFPHWYYGNTGRVKPFSIKDNGGDIVETSFLIQGLLTARQYFNKDISDENLLRKKINKLWDEVEWNWYTNTKEVLIWHWSPNYEWDINLEVKGYNEALITYILAASSKTFAIRKSVYTNGWVNGNDFINVLESKCKPYIN